MALQMPPGKRIAVCLTPDFDAQSVWMGTFGSVSPSSMSRGEFGAEVGAPRLLDTFARYGITTTWCLPTHTIQTFRGAADAVLTAGHEIAAHGVYHEYIPKLEKDEERRLLELQLTQLDRLLGIRPRGYRSPALDFTENTLQLLEDCGFEWDSSLMGRDFEPYRPRPVTRVSREEGNTFGEPSRILEIPVTWYLDDFPEFEVFKGNTTIQSTSTVLDRWVDTFDFAYDRVPAAVLTWTLHPQTSGRAQNLLMLERFLDHVVSHDGVWFPTLSEVHDAWVEDPAEAHGHPADGATAGSARP